MTSCSSFQRSRHHFSRLGLAVALVACLFAFVPFEAGISTRVALACDFWVPPGLSADELHRVATGGSIQTDQSQFGETPPLQIEASDVVGAYRYTVVAVVQENPAAAGGHLTVLTSTWGDVGELEPQGAALEPVPVADTDNCGHPDIEIDTMRYAIDVGDEYPIYINSNGREAGIEADLTALLGEAQPVPLPSDFDELVATLQAPDVGPVVFSSSLDSEVVDAIPQPQRSASRALWPALAIVAVIALCGAGFVFARRRTE